MIALTPEEAFCAYEAARHRLPAPVPRPHAYRRLATLEDLIEQYDAFLLDAFGVLNIGETAIPGTRERIDAIRAQGKRVLVVSNAASLPPAALEAKYRRLGFDFPPEDIITSRAAMIRLGRALEGVHWGVMSAAGAGFEDLEALRYSVLRDDPADYAAVDGFLLVGSGNWTEARQNLLEDALHGHPRRLVVANPDIAAPREAGFSAEPGHFAHRLADACGIEPEFFGKPFGNIFDLAFARLGPVPRERVLMVGDSLHTDILGAQAAGVASALVASYGFFSGRDVAAAIERTGIVPNFIVDRP